MPRVAEEETAELRDELTRVKLLLQRQLRRLSNPVLPVGGDARHLVSSSKGWSWSWGLGQGSGSEPGAGVGVGVGTGVGAGVGSG